MDYPSPHGRHFRMEKNHMAVIDAPYYTHISEKLRAGAIAFLKEKDITYDIITVTGALEIPIAISLYARDKEQYNGFIALGCVIRGETSHYDTVCNESARALMDLGIHHHIPIGNGILTVENEDQALRRADPNQMNKGYHAAAACYDLYQHKRRHI